MRDCDDAGGGGVGRAVDRGVVDGSAAILGGDSAWLCFLEILGDDSSRTMSEVHSPPALITIELGLLLRLDSDGLIRSMVGPGVVGGVEKVSVSGDRRCAIVVCGGI